MKSRRPLVWAGTAVLTVVLVFVLFKVSKLDLRVTLQQLRSVSLSAFSRLVLLTGFHVYLSNLKWRAVDASLRQATESAPSRTMSFALTSTGVALGQVLPVQLSMSLARTMGTYFHGRAFKRGTGGTLFEQAFDVVIVVFLALASGITRLFHGGVTLWSSCALAALLIAFLASGIGVQLIRSMADTFAARVPAPTNRLLLGIASLQHSGFLNADLARKLMLLSAARFAIQVLMAVQSAQAVGVSIPLWQFAAAMPFVIIACVIVATPGGIGVNELSYATTLHMFGTPLNVGAQWALANRFLVASSCIVVALCAVSALGLARIASAAGSAKIMQEE